MTRLALRSDLFPRIKQAALNTIARMRAPRHSVRVASELRELLPRFLANRRLDLEQLREALARGDFEEARRIGHSLRGAGGGYGFDEITRLGADIERCAKAGGRRDLAELVARLAEHLDRVEVTFEE
jgi:HPt (histidine-containing phosphotransfer) domain-containing protein